MGIAGAQGNIKGSGKDRSLIAQDFATFQKHSQQSLGSPNLQGWKSKWARDIRPCLACVWCYYNQLYWSMQWSHDELERVISNDSLSFLKMHLFGICVYILTVLFALYCFVAFFTSICIEMRGERKKCHQSYLVVLVFWQSLHYRSYSSLCCFLLCGVEHTTAIFLSCYSCVKAVALLLVGATRVEKCRS